MDPLRPYDITKHFVGSVRVVYAPITEAIPANLADVTALVANAGAYALAGDWEDFGTIPDGEEVVATHGRDSEGIAIENDNGNLYEEITDVTRGLKVTLAELGPEVLQILENAPSIDTIAAAAGKSAQKGVPIGSYASLARYRVGFIGKRPIEAGVVTEPVTLKERPRLGGYFLNRCTLASDDQDITFGKGKLAQAEVAFTAFPEPGVAAEESYGTWLLEDAGTIT